MNALFGKRSFGRDPDDPFAGEPTKDELDAAWCVLLKANLQVVGNISVAELGRIAAGNPNYSPAEIRMAGSILVLRAALLARGAAA